MTSDEWGALEGGIIFEIDGTVPGNIRLFIELESLRGMFPNKGHGFVVHLEKCSSVVYTAHNGSPVTHLRSLESKELEISCLSLVNPVELSCQEASGAQGDLILDYESAYAFLDTGASLLENDLHIAYKKCWDAEASREGGNETVR